ncbi:transglycosylase domain-containing protein [Streptomyces sp. VRA16 Mangrove soil]|uniref:transglycosylase domain-containing protein n=1 Tax=Streptomyces sp. VRA16 Mangrove soil TaxID=2817434 RepID=UPI001A9F6090|nr:transglycosylase domain-containing protein [Streptomyces sp. VRA16 Mangrove soil]MBO1336778.1 penicillin-binding protein [Streptomyces sp. VRA16 Mangrove soil]
MSEHRRKPPQPQGGGRAAARRGASGTPSGRRAAPRGASGSPSASYGAPSSSGSHGSEGEDRPWGGRAEARRAAQRSGSTGGRRRGPDGGAGRGGAGGGGRRGGGGSGGPNGPGRGRGRGSGRPEKKRFIDYPRAYKDGWRRWVPSWRLVTGMGVGFFGSLMVAAGIAYAMVGVPQMADTAKAQNNVYYWADGTQMVATGGETNRQIINYADIPKSMRYAVMSAENKTFESDKGVDPMGIARAVFNMAKGGETQGGSTITQQYVKNAMLDDQSQTVSRKLKELFVSIKVGQTVNKETIMAGYLNTAYYGRGAYGIQAAARTYFDKNASDLSPSQTAFLASVLKGATYFDPAGAPEIDPVNATREKNTKRAKERWAWILGEEVKDGRLSATDRDKYLKAGFPHLQSPRSNAQLGGQIGYLVDLAKAYVINNSNGNISADDLQKGGYEIHTTFDRKKVNELEAAVKKVRKESIKPDQRDKDKYVQFGGASVNPKTGAIEAIYGGADATKHFTNNADVTGAQVGSTFKPFVLAAAFKYGVKDPDQSSDQPESARTIVSPKSLYSGKNKLKIKNYDGTVWTDKEGKEWLQTNDGGASYNPPSYQIDLREAMRESVNSAYVQLGMDVGLDKVKESALSAGLLENSFASANYPSFSLGTSDPSAIRMAGAYATFATSGQQNDPFSVSSVDLKGDTIYRHESKPKRAFDPKVADNVTDVLKTVVDKGTGTAAKLPGRDVAGKTGTTDGNKSAWFVGYTKQLSTAITMYRMDDNENSKNRKFLEMYGTGGQEKIHGASFPAQIWHDYMAKAMSGQPYESFETPESIGKVVGATPSPTPTPTVSSSPSSSPTASPTPSQSSTGPSPSTTQSCSKWDWNCSTGGATGGTNGGTTDGGTSSSPSPTESTANGNSRGNGNGGLFGGTG